MKKIIALMLALVCCFALFACGEEEVVTNGVLDTITYYGNSQPTRVETVTCQTILDDDGVSAVEELNGNYVLVTGKINGKIATVKTYTQDVLRSIEDGSTDKVLPPKTTVSGSEEYLEDYGYRVNGGAWNPDGYNFSPALGAIAIGITEANVGSYTYTEEKYNNTLTFTVANAKIGEVFGVDEDGVPMIIADSDVDVVITNNGAVVTSITLSYYVEADGDYPAREVTVSVSYTYAVEEVTLTK